MTTHERKLTESVRLEVDLGRRLNPDARGWSRRLLQTAKHRGNPGPMVSSRLVDSSIVSVRIIVDDVDESVDFYVRHFGFEVLTHFPPFADVKKGNLRLLLSGPQSSAARPMDDGTKPVAGGWNRIHFIVDDIDAEFSRLERAGVRFRNPIVRGPGGSQVLAVDPSGNLIELFQPAI